jgi:4-amino-4-deoxy-L-arabinose transferase-like glycosyltransferase
MILPRPSPTLPIGARPRLAVILLLLVAAGACTLVWANTRWGVGLRGDSYAYISGARNLADGLGYSRISGGGEVKPITHFPPLFSLLLAAPELAGVDAVDAARALVLLLAGLNTLWIGAFGWRLAARPWVGLAAAILFGLNPLVVDLHSWAMAEPLFLFLTFATLWMLTGLDGHVRFRRALLAGTLAGLAFLTRYVGAAGILTGLSVLVAYAAVRRAQAAAPLGFLLGSVLPVAAWVGRNWIVAGTTTNRTLVWHPIESARWGEAADTFAAWVLPETILGPQTAWPWIGALLGFGCLVATVLAVLLRRRSTGASDAGFVRVLSAYALVYVAVLLGNLLFLDSSTPLNSRILVPVLAVLTPLLVVWSGEVLGGRPALASATIAIAVFAAVGGFALDSRVLLEQGWSRGWGFSNRAWQLSQVLPAVRSLPEVILYTNEPDLVYFQTGRPSYIIFGATDPVTGRKREGYDGWLEQAHQRLAAGGAALVLIKPDDQLASPEDRDMIEALSAGLVVTGRYEDGVILMAGASP